MASTWVRVAGSMSATVFSGLIASGGIAWAQQAGGDASSDRVAVGFVQPDADDVRPLPVLGTSDRLINVFGAAQNVSTSDPGEHIYLYEPPLRFRVADDGMILVRRNDYDPRKVIFYLEGMNQAVAERIPPILDAKEGRKVLAGNVRPLPYTYIVLNDDSESWWARYPKDNADLPSPAERWIPFEVDFTGHEDGVKRADEFVDRLKTREVEFRVRLRYGGREIVQNTVELTTRRLLSTSFITDLTGDGEFRYVTRNQIQAALAAARTEIERIEFIEDPDVTVPPLEWPEQTWDRINVTWDVFLSDFLARTSRYGIPGGDLTPDRFTRLEEHLKSEMEDRTKNHIDVSMEAEAGFLGIGGSAGGQMTKDDFEQRRRLNENGVEWEGEVFRPRSIDLFVVNASSLANEDRIASYVITARLGTRRYSFNISSRQDIARSGQFLSGAVVAFDREDGCPPGWSEYRDADGRFVVGTGRHSVHDAYGAEIANLGIGEVGGERAHRLSVDEMPSHEHEIKWGDEPAVVGYSVNGSWRPPARIDVDDGRPWRDWETALYVTPAGGSQAHNNMPPYVALRFCRLN